MPPLKDVSSSRTPEQCLSEAVRAQSAEARARLAQEGLDQGAGDVAPDTEVLLLRQLYLAHLDAHRFRHAADLALRAAGVGPLADVLRHDASRALAALGELDAAIEQQRWAARVSPAERRSFHYWALGTLLHHAGQYQAAISAMTRGERWAHADRALLRAHRAWICLEAGEPVEQLGSIVSDLERSKTGGGYGQLVLGMLSYRVGDLRRAAVHLRAFLRRNADADSAKAITLREELRRARSVLAELESD